MGSQCSSGVHCSGARADELEAAASLWNVQHGTGNQMHTSTNDPHAKQASLPLTTLSRLSGVSSRIP